MKKILLLLILFPSFSWAKCVPAGCNGEICVDVNLSNTISTTCEAKEEFKCYKSFGKCTELPDKTCSWILTPKLANCLKEIAK